MSSKKRKQKDLSEFTILDRHEKKRCIGCSYRVRDNKEFQKHLKKHKCDQVIVCKKCGIFRTIVDSMYKEHFNTCTGKLLEEKEDDDEEEEEEVIEIIKPKKKKKIKK